MAVRDAQTIDTIARSADGLLVLALTEDRPYTPDDAATLAEELRVKLNVYIYALKTGQIAERRDGEPAVVLLYAASPPTPEVLDILRVAGEVLAGDGVSVDWRLLDSASARDYTAVLRDIAAGLMQAVPASWSRLVYHATMVGDRRRDGLTVETTEGPVDLPGAPDHVRTTVEELKQVMWTPDRGTWLGIELTIDRATGQLSPGFNFDLEPAGAPLSAEDYVAELRRFPRPPESLPDWLAGRIGETG